MRTRDLPLAAAIGCCTIPLAYASLALVQHAFFPSPDPRLVSNVEHIAFFWRLSLASYVAVLTTIGALAAARRFPLDRALSVLMTATTLIALVQALVWP